MKACTSKEELDRWEKYFIKSRDTKNPNGYNLTDGGEGLAGMKHKPETIAKMSATKLGKKRSAETRAKISAARTGEKNPLFGKNRSLETCIKVSMKKRHNSPFKNLLREMDARKLSYRSLVKLLGLSSHASVSRRMRGEYNFTEKDKAKLEKIFGLSAEYLLQHDE